MQDGQRELQNIAPVDYQVDAVDVAGVVRGWVAHVISEAARGVLEFSALIGAN